MDMFGGYVIPAAPVTVWTALSDLRRVQAALPYPASLTDIGLGRFALVTAPATDRHSATYTAEAGITEVDPLKSLRFKVDGRDTSTRLAIAEGKIELISEGDDTRLVYALRVAAWDRDRPISQPLLEATARRLVDAFFERFWLPFGEVARLDPGTGAIAERPRDGLPPLVWASGLVLVIAILLGAALLLGGH